MTAVFSHSTTLAREHAHVAYMSQQDLQVFFTDHACFGYSFLQRREFPRKKSLMGLYYSFYYASA